jgi:hypothetical protein
LGIWISGSFAPFVKIEAKNANDALTLLGEGKQIAESGEGEDFAERGTKHGRERAKTSQKGAMAKRFPGEGEHIVGEGLRGCEGVERGLEEADCGPGNTGCFKRGVTFLSSLILVQNFMCSADIGTGKFGFSHFKHPQ